MEFFSLSILFYACFPSVSSGNSRRISSTCQSLRPEAPLCHRCNSSLAGTGDESCFAAAIFADVHGTRIFIFYAVLCTYVARAPCKSRWSRLGKLRKSLSRCRAMARMKKKPADETLFLLIRNWLTIYLPTERAVSPNTISSYRDALNQYLAFLGERNGVALAGITFEMMNSESLNAFLDHLQKDLELSKATRNSRLAALRAFIRYASGCKPEYISVAMDVAKIKSQKDDPYSKVEYLTETATKAILSVPDMSTKIGRRDRAILVLLYDTGARISGLLGIRLADLRMDSTTPTVTVVEKGNISRAIPISK